ncbi:uncharacterized protein C8A04DRAFT_34058 [Dichotomopilus funicola]|uniref:SET domain-containing protein n=1 Tax=Dichotomopilus funicola TaxID=1934379 RepID=A0AAN6V9M3_9PEZI|nr:hypothetical protein C8A04DRAFT_34058 [Dichotomopilus funicola]
MERRRALLRWAKAQGIRKNGISFVEIPGRGNGMVAQRRLKEGQTILVVPPEAIHSLHSIPRTILQRLPRDISIHALLAAELALDTSEDLEPWRSMLPTLSDFKHALPFMWHEELHAMLPRPAKHIIRQQQARFARDWGLISTAFPKMSLEEFLYTWFIVNTRAFYYVTEQMEAYPPDDRLALVPLQDFFNHADDGCRVSFSPGGCYEVRTNRTYRAGEEIYLSYGDHSNDFLLAEYGFVMEENRWDQACLEDVILPKLNAAQKAQLESRCYLGPFTIKLDADNLVCHKTRVALGLLCCTPEESHTILETTGECGQVSQHKVDKLLAQLLHELWEKAEETIAAVGETSVGQSEQRELIIGRWKQIQATVMKAINRLEPSVSVTE